MVTAASQEASLLAKALHSRRIGFFLDVDGTLLGFKERPEEVVADADLLELLGRLEKRAEGALALVSGRRVKDLDRIFAPMIFPAGGVHGAELRFADGRREIFEGAALTAVRAAAVDFVAAHSGLRLEDKGGAAFAIHFRQAPDLEGRVLAFLKDAVREEGLMVQPGKMVAEVKPEGCDKGRAIAALMATRPFVDRVPLFIGDDLTDEHGFDAVNERGGVSIKVGHMSEPTRARHRLPDPAAVRSLLREFSARSAE